MYFEEQKIEENISKPREIDFPSQFKVSQLKKIYAVANRSYAVFENEIISWGKVIFKSEDQSFCEDSTSNGNKNVVIIPVKVSELALGSNHTFAYKNSNEVKEQESSVYCWGSNRNYELGLQEQKEYGLVKVDLFDQAFEAGFILNQISCGQSHTLAVFKDEQTKETKLFGWGESKSYQLALDTTGIIPYPVDIDYDFTSQIDKVYSKSDYNIAIMNDGDLYSWGSNMFNRLGFNQTKIVNGMKLQLQNSKTQNQPNTSRQEIHFSKELNNNPDDMSFTDRRALNSQNSSTNIQKMKIPRKIQISNKKIARLALGTYHVIAMTSQSECFSWGNGIYGQLGNNKFGEFSPQKISTKHLSPDTIFIDCAAGEQHSSLLDQEGNVYTCGSNSYGVLGHQKHQNQTRKKRCKIFEKVDFFEENNIKIRYITSGDRHMLAFSETSKVYGWGLNKHHQVKLSEIEEHFLKRNHKKDIFEQNKQSKIGNENYPDNHKKKTPDVRVKFSQSISSQQMSESKLMSMKMKEHLHNLPISSVNDSTKNRQLKDWKERFHKFLTEKRKEEDEFLKELDMIINGD